MYRIKLQTLAALSIIVFVWAFHPQFVFLGSDVIGSLYANVGVGAGVAPSDFTKLAEQIDTKEKELAEREAAIVEAETKATERSSAEGFTIEWYVTLMAFILLVLVLMNFYLDFRHREEYRT